MAGLEWPKIATFLLFLSSVFLFLDVNANECSGGCKKGVDPTDGFVKGFTYTYALDGSANVFLTTTNGQETGATISAEATVYALGNCSHLLKVSSVQFTGPDGKKYPGSDDFAKPIRFTMQDGVISPQLCAEEGDSERSLNVKRAIISMLQTATEQKTEVDIFGVCPTKFTKTGTKIQKTKNFISCKSRGQSGHDALYQIHSSGTAFKSSKVMKGVLKSEITLNSGIVERAVAQEEYYYTPFSVKQAGAKANVDTKLVLKDVKEGTLSANCIFPKSITFKTSKEVYDENSFENMKTVLKMTTKNLDGHVQQKSASFFAALIRVMRGATTKDLYKLYAQINNDSSNENKELTNKVFLDALFRVGTGNSIEMIIKLIKDKGLNKIQEKLAMGSLTGVRYASEDTLNAMTDLLDVPNLPNEVYLGAGAIAAAYYRGNADRGYNKTMKEAAVALSAKLVSRLGSCKDTSKENENMMVSVLKGLRNMNRIEENALETLLTCVTDETVKPRVKVAALETLTVRPCKLKVRAAAFEILKDITADSEMRIKAYLVLVECPSKKLSKTLENLLSSADTSNQVGSFITSSLKNIQESEGETTRAARIIFKSFEFPSDYPINARKYSQAFYSAYSLNVLDARSLVQSNVIYSQNSFMPRSVNFNLTAEVFGKNINLIEVGARQGNLDRVLEKYFGPKGSLKTPQQIFDSWKETTNNLYNKIQKRFAEPGHKTKRDVQEEIAALGEKLKTGVAEYKEDFDFDVYVKLFGSESLFLSLGDDQDFSIEGIVDRLLDSFEKGIDATKEFSYEVRSHMLFLDMELAYPTSSGMSIKLSTEGASTAKFTFGGDFDLRQIFGDILNAKVDFQLVPSASIEVIGTLSVDTDAFSAGLKTISNLQTSTGVHFTGKLLDGKGFDVKLGLPIERQEIITASNDVVFYTREKGQMDVEKRLIFDIESYAPKPDCYENLAKASGLTLCIETVKPKRPKGKTARTPSERFYPLNGPAKYAIYLDKSGVESYNFKGISAHFPLGLYYEISVEAEGAKLPIKFVLRHERKNTGDEVHVVLDSPIKRIEVTAGSINTKDTFKVHGDILYGQDRIKGQLGFTVQVDNKRSTFKPILEFEKPGYNAGTVKVTGLMHVDKLESGITATFDGLGISIGENKVALEGSSTITEGVVTWDLKGAGSKNTASTKGKVLFKDGHTGSSEIDFQNSLRPQWNILFKNSYSISTEPENLFSEFNITLIHGPDFETKANVITYNLRSSGVYDVKNELKARETLTYPLYELQYTNELEYKDDEKFLLSFNGKYKKRTLEMVLDMENNEKDDISSGKLRAIMDGVGGEIYLKTDDTDDDLTKITSYLFLTPDKKYEMFTTMKGFDSDDDDDNMDLHFTTVVTFPNKVATKCDIMFFSKENSIKTRAILSTGVVTYFEFAAKLDNENNLADLKLFLKDIVMAKADYALKLNDQKAVSVISVEFYELEKVYQIETEVIINTPKFSGEVKAYTDYSKNKKEVYRFTTASIIEDNKVDSKNLFFYGNEQAKLNVKLSKEDEGGFYSVEADLIDFNETNYKFTYSQKSEEEDDTYNTDIQLLLAEVDNDGTNSVTLTWKVKLDDFNLESGEGSAYAYLNLNDSDGDMLACNVSTMNKETELQSEAEYKFNLAGSLLPTNVSLYGWYEIEENEATLDVDYKLNGECGQDRSLEFVGNISYDASSDLLKNNLYFEGNFPKNYYGQKIIFESEDEVVLTKEGFLYEEILVSARCGIDGKMSSVIVTYDISGDKKNGNLHLLLPEMAPLMLEMVHQEEFNSEGNELHTSSSMLITMNNEEVSFNSTGYTVYPLGNQGEYNVAIHLPEKWGHKFIKTDIVYLHDGRKNFNTNITVDLDDKIYNYVTAFNFTRDEILLLDIKKTYPDSSVERFYIKADDLSSQDFHGQVIVKNIGDFNLDLDVDGKLKSTEDFKLILDIDCAEASFNKVHFEAVSELVDGDQHVKIVATENKKNFLDGSMKYKINVVEGALHVNGDGKLTFRGKEKSSKFQYTYLNNNGIFVTFDGAVEGYKFKLDHQNSKDYYKFLYLYQVDGIDHATVSLESKIDFLMMTRVKTAEFLNINVDLRKIGFPTEFGLSTKAEFMHPIPVYSMVAHATKDDRYYAIENTVKKDKSRIQTLLKINLPTREIYMETSNTYSYSLARSHISPLLGEVIIYLNKTNPQSKTHFKASLDFFNREKYQYDLNGEVFFVHPGMKKDWKIEMESKGDLKSCQADAKVVIDVFKQPDQRLIVFGTLAPKISDDHFGFEAKLESDGKLTGLDISYFGIVEFQMSGYNSLKLEANSSTAVGTQMQDYKFHCSFDPSQQQFFVKYPAGDLVNYKNMYKMEGDSTQSKINWQSELILYNNLTYNCKGDYDSHNGTHANWNAVIGSDGILSLSASSLLEKGMGLTAKYNYGNEDYPLFNIGYDLSNAKSPVSTYEGNKPGLRKFFGGMAENGKAINNIRNQFNDDNDKNTKDIKIALTAFISETVTSLQLNYFKEEMVAILNEIKADSFLEKMLKPFEIYMNIWANLHEALSGVLTKINEFSDAIYKFWETTDFISCTSSEELLTVFITFTEDLIDPMVDYTLNFVKAVVVFNKNYASVWNSGYNFVFNAFTVVCKSVNNIKETVPNVYNAGKELLMNSFIARVIDGRFQFFSTEDLKNHLQSFEEAFKNVLPEKEWSLFKKKMLYFNDMETHRNEKDFKKMTFIDVVKSANRVIMGAVRRAMAEYGVNINWHYKAFLHVMKKIFASFLSSTEMKLKIRSDEDIDESVDYLWSLLSGQKNIVFSNKLKGFIAGGEHIFTFDGNHYYFPGDCKYVLAQDAVDGNFSIIMHLEKGKPKSVTVADKTGSSVQIDNERKVIEEGLDISNLKVSKRPNFFAIKSTYGVSVKCSYNLDMCYFKVSGYYFGKLRGLLGDGNNEAVDDFRLPNGEIASSEYELGNAYALSSDCPEIIPAENDSETTTETETEETTEETAEETAGKTTDTETGNETETKNKTENETETETKNETETGNDTETGNETETETSTDDDTETEATTENNENSEEEERTDYCAEIFDEDSNLSDCYSITDMDIYNAACKEVVAAAPTEDEKSAACLIARTFVLASKANKCFTTLPDICVRCEVDGDLYESDDESVTVNTPSKKADIVLVVEMAKSNKETFENIVIPVMDRIREELKLSNVDDLKVYLAGIKQGTSHPMFFDFDNGNLNESMITFDGEGSDVDRYQMPFVTNHSNVDKFLQDAFNTVKYSLEPFVLDDTEIAFWKLRYLQLRPNATKTFILVQPERCPGGLTISLLNYYEQYLMKDEGAVVHLISPMLSLSSDEHEDLVGFSNDQVYSIGDKSMKHEDIYYKHDMCAALAVGTHGNVYSTHAFPKMAAEQKEKYINLTAKTVTDSMTKFAYEKECSCELGFMELFPQVTCETTSRKKITE